MIPQSRLRGDRNGRGERKRIRTHLRVTPGEGATGELILPIILERIVPRLWQTPDPLSTSMTLGRQRVVSIQVVNGGGATTGPLEVLLSPAP